MIYVKYPGGETSEFQETLIEARITGIAFKAIAWQERDLASSINFIKPRKQEH